MTTSTSTRLSLLLATALLAACPKVPEPDPLVPAPRVLSFTTSAVQVSRGDRVTLTWATENAESIKLDLFPGNLSIRGVKKLYKPERLDRIVRPEIRLMPSQHCAYQLHELELEKWEALLLSRIDGTRTNAEIVAMAHRPELQVKAFLAAMLGVQILEARET